MLYQKLVPHLSAVERGVVHQVCSLLQKVYQMKAVKPPLNEGKRPEALLQETRQLKKRDPLANKDERRGVLDKAGRGAAAGVAEAAAGVAEAAASVAGAVAGVAEAVARVAGAAGSMAEAAASVAEG